MDEVDNPLAFTPVEIVLGVSTLVGLVATCLLASAATRSRLAWSGMVFGAVLAILVPVFGPVVALKMYAATRRLESRA